MLAEKALHVDFESFEGDNCQHVGLGQIRISLNPYSIPIFLDIEI